MWLIIIVLLLAAVVAGFCYLVTRLPRFGIFSRFGFSAKKEKLISFVIVLVLFCISALFCGIWNSAVIFIHLILIWLICDLAGLLLKKAGASSPKQYIAGYAAILLTAAYLCAGYVTAHRVVRTSYTLTTAKALPSETFRIAGFSDSHVGTLFTADGLSEYVSRINAENPDIVVIVGDFVDDSTTRDQMEKACSALSELTPKYGTYYVFGNHDSGYYSGSRGYGREELIASLEENGVSVLEDETVTVADSVAVVGRLDKQYKTRTPADDLIASDEKYTVVLDHQPNDYDAEAASGADLVLSGHTHGGQLIPINRVGELIGANDRTYGHEKRDNTDFIVSSGIGDWELWFKTGCVSEYFVVDISH